MLLRYKAKHFPLSLSEDEKQLWEQYRSRRLKGALPPRGMEAFMNTLQQLAIGADDNQKFLLQELKLYGESVAPFENEELL